MRIRIFLIIFVLAELCCSDTNLTYNSDYSNYPSCPISSIRGKRAVGEYTRWRWNQATKQEFIVKVDDEALSSTTPANVNPILAVNIQSATKAAEKIIVGGAIVPPAKAMLSETEMPLEYTRFVPPTTVKVTQVEGELYLAPAVSAATQFDKELSHTRFLFPKFLAKHSHRDESPPASPQFISRTPMVVARQYVPITPVAFFPRVGLSPVTPPIILQQILRETTLHPHRTSDLPNIETVTRTDSNLEISKISRTIPQDINPLDSLFSSSEDEDGQRDKSIRGSTLYFITPDLVTNALPIKSEEDEGIIPEIMKIPTPGSDFVYHMLPAQTSYIPTAGAQASSLDERDIMYEGDTDISVRKTEAEQSISNKYNERNNEVINQNDNLKHDSEENLIQIEDTDSDKNYDNVTSLSTDNDNEESLPDGEVEVSTATLTDNLIMSTLQSLREKRRPVCTLLELRQLKFDSPRTLPEIVAQLKRWTDDSPIAKWVDISGDNYTTMENPIYMMIIDDPSSGQVLSAKNTVMIVAGIQGRDHHAVAAALYILYQLIDRSEAHTDLLTKYRFWIIPVLNPDGYDYSMTFPQRREWTKNLRQSWDSCKGRESCRACEAYGLRCTVQACYGVNLDRNFEYQWIPPNELHSEQPCGELYPGLRQLSEHETRAFTRYLHNERAPIHTFIALKEGEVLGVMYPYSHTKKKRAFDSVYRQRASRAASAAYSISGRPYVAGQTSEFLPLYAGGIEDWIDGHLGIDNTFTIMMFRPTDSYDMKLITERVVHEAYAAMDTLLLHSLDAPIPQPVRLARSGGCTDALPAFLLMQATLMITFNS